MDRTEQEVRSLGFFGIFGESFRIIFSGKKIFALITLSFIFPLTVVYLLNFVLSQYLFFHLLYHLRSPSDRTDLSRYYSKEWVTFALFKVGYFIVCLTLSLLATAAVVYTVACRYTGNDVTLKKVLGVIPKVWKRLLVTFIWSVGILFLFNLVTFFLFYLLLTLARHRFSVIVFAIELILLVLYLIGFVYLSMVWQLANVVSMLEKGVYGRQAMLKAKALVKGKKLLAGGIFFLLCVLLLALHVGCEFFLIEMTAASLILGAVLVFLLVSAILLGLVVETVLYWVCKSYHGETIDRSLLAGHLEVIHLGLPVVDAKGDEGQIELGDQARP